MNNKQSTESDLIEEPPRTHFESCMRFYHYIMPSEIEIVEGSEKSFRKKLEYQLISKITSNLLTYLNTPEDYEKENFFQVYITVSICRDKEKCIYDFYEIFRFTINKWFFEKDDNRFDIIKKYKYDFNDLSTIITNIEPKYEFIDGHLTDYLIKDSVKYHIKPNFKLFLKEILKIV
ncbi:MAG: hypothetical protein FWC41_02135 [Firmicutes bacterium]|nr:hypothetical protein [Bacillota bacterium]